MIEKIMLGMFIALVVGSAVYTLWRFARRPNRDKIMPMGSHPKAWVRCLKVHIENAGEKR